MQARLGAAMEEKRRVVEDSRRQICEKNDELSEVVQQMQTEMVA